jgi:hypothetical protein
MICGTSSRRRKSDRNFQFVSAKEAPELFRFRKIGDPGGIVCQKISGYGIRIADESLLCVPKHLTSSSSCLTESAEHLSEKPTSFRFVARRKGCEYVDA